jgi:hypothetical protein
MLKSVTIRSGSRPPSNASSAAAGLAKAWTDKPSSTDAARRVRMLRLVTRSSMTAILAIYASR